MIKQTIILSLLTLTFTACANEKTSAPPPPPPISTPTVLATTQETIVEKASAAPTDIAAAPAATELPTDAPLPETATPSPTTPVPTDEPVAVIEPIEVTYFTPAQGEGPYYPVEKLADRDNDLAVLAGATALPAGEIVEFGGKVYDANGWPIEGLTVEIWQTDAQGIYLHPGDSKTAQRDPNFQFYGESVTTADGSYSFRTILPGQYEPRPRHVHLKVKNGQQELLTSQIYFQGDTSLEADGLFLSSGNESVYLVMALAAGSDASGNPILVGEHNIILNADLSGN